MKESITNYRELVAVMKDEKREEYRKIANSLYNLGYRISEIADIMYLKESTVRSLIPWKE